VVATTTDLADFARQVGGDKVNVYCILKGGDDPHFVRPTPGEQRRLHEAQVFLQIGLDLEIWAPMLIEGARNPKLLIQTCSKGMKVLEKYAQGVTPAQGDVHPAGNPHIMHDPTNAKIAVSNVLAALIAVAPQQEAYFKQRARTYLQQLDARIAVWKQKMAPCKGKKIVAFHNSWPYLAAKFGLQVVGFVEPLPGIPPKGKDLARLVDLMKAQGVKVIITEPFYPRATADSVARQTGARVLELAGYPGSLRGTDTYIQMMDHNLNALAAALR
jgi:ABC-type Zn uptake system ZnuABC Zn-binding protein ZnuA